MKVFNFIICQVFGALFIFFFASLFSLFQYGIILYLFFGENFLSTSFDNVVAYCVVLWLLLLIFLLSDFSVVFRLVNYMLHTTNNNLYPLRERKNEKLKKKSLAKAKGKTRVTTAYYDKKKGDIRSWIATSELSLASVWQTLPHTATHTLFILCA